MLRLRICPKCHEETYSRKSYFCHRCGAQISPPSEVEEVPVEPVETRHAASLPSRHVLISAALFIFVAAAGIGVYYYLLHRPVKPLVPATTPLSETLVAQSLFPIENYPFSAKGLSEVVPAEVDLYLESSRPEEILPALVSSEDWRRIESALSEQIGLSAAESASFLEEEFAILQESTSSAFIARVKSVDFLQGKVAEFGATEGLPAGGQGWRAKLLQGYLIIYNSEDMFTAIEGAMKKLLLNLSLVADFVEARKELPASGQVFYYGTKRLEFMPDSLKGNAFVISKKGEGTLITGL